MTKNTFKILYKNLQKNDLLLILLLMFYFGKINILYVSKEENKLCS